MTQVIHRLPRVLVRSVRDCYLSCLDAVDRLTGRADELTPPRALHFVGGGDFRAVGNAFLGHFRKEAGLTPDAAVLDIGCGTGRMAIPLLGYLSGNGSYTGFDISRPAIEWCRARISQRNPRFRFEHADIYNLEYNPGGAVRAEDYRFPRDDESVDFACATSVFTHMHGHEIRRYLAELRRVLRPAGRGLLTFFIADAGAGAPALNFRFRLGEGSTIDPRTPERAIAYPEAWIREAVGVAGLELDGAIRFGSWSGRQGLDFQDMVVVRCKGAA